MSVTEKVVAVSIDKIQTFLYRSIKSQTNEAQSEKNTLRQVINASRLISEDFHGGVDAKFKRNEKEEGNLLKCSGVYIFTVRASDEEISSKLQEIFKDNYIKTGGDILTRGIYFEKASDEKLTLIQKAKKELKQNRALSEMIEANQDLLFAPRNPRVPPRKSDVELGDYVVRELDELADVQEDNPHFRLAIIKADLDGIGKKFEGMEGFSDYANLSKILNKRVHFNAFKEIVKDKKVKTFPLYIAGDDIFFAINAKDTLKGISICEEMLTRINNDIAEEKKLLKMSVSVEFVFNREPLRFYYTEVEEKLKKAKSVTICKEIEECVPLKIIIGNEVFLKVDNDKKVKNFRKNDERAKFNRIFKEKEYSNWDYFIYDIKLIKHLQDSDRVIGTTSFFYNLLELAKSDDNDLSYMNNILYNLLPQYTDHYDKNKRNNEMILLERLMSKFLVEKEKKWKIDVTETTKRKFINYLQTIVLFSDERFPFSLKEFKPANVDAKRTSNNFYNKIRHYLYDSMDRSVRRVFIEKDNHQYGEKKVEIYRKLRMSTSLFYRLKKVMSAGNWVGNATELIQKAQIQTEQTESDESDKILPLTFCTKCFEKASNQVTVELVDRIMIFYLYDELSIRHKVQQKEGK
ncbi:Cas10/Cmr2 second palm domain-containing protein [Listeria goaensis]|uniref:Cas10/Cmr2 second palm domain-containing protein n=1 Tax=Listeria goaensis TaxID=1649188 RepID=UPI000B58849C|nr:hypothetical protein [Listeria goaensis]